MLSILKLLPCLSTRLPELVARISDTRSISETPTACEAITIRFNFEHCPGLVADIECGPQMTSFMPSST